MTEFEEENIFQNEFKRSQQTKLCCYHENEKNIYKKKETLSNVENNWHLVAWFVYATMSVSE